jgi:hypothetical protein
VISLLLLLCLHVNRSEQIEQTIDGTAQPIVPFYTLHLIHIFSSFFRAGLYAAENSCPATALPGGEPGSNIDASALIDAVENGHT